MQSRWLLCFLFSLPLSLAACGDDDDSSSSGGSGGSSGGVVSTTGGVPSGQGGTSSGGATNGDDGGAGGQTQSLSFFVTSDTSVTGDLGGLTGADARCQALADAVGAGDKTFHAYLSADADPDDGDMPVDARDRIGDGPWYNAKGVLLAEDGEALHALLGDAELFLDENGNKIPGQWLDSPKPVEHDILTGSNADGTLSVGKTCMSWTSSATTEVAVVGHSDGLGPMMATTGTYTSWNSSHENMDCSDTAPRGGAGRLYCFAIE
jgi:hypothetical protein